MTYPGDLKYTNDHEWIKLEEEQSGKHLATIGITEFAQKELGDIVYVELETLNQDLEKQASFGTIEAVKTVADLYMPIGGKVVEINEELEETPELINDDPYGKGWMIKIEVASIEELNEMMDAEKYESLVTA